MRRNRTLRPETSYGRIGGRPRQTIEGARELRHAMTPAERVLWQALRRHQVAGLHFRRQHPVGPFVLDFACAAHHLAIEVDGAIHNEQADQDQARTGILAEYGWRVLRFTNDDVMNELVSVIAAIEAAVTAPSPDPSPESGRGAQATSIRNPGSAHRGAVQHPRGYASPALGGEVAPAAPGRGRPQEGGRSC